MAPVMVRAALVFSLGLCHAFRFDTEQTLPGERNLQFASLPDDDDDVPEPPTARAIGFCWTKHTPTGTDVLCICTEECDENCDKACNAGCDKECDGGCDNGCNNGCDSRNGKGSCDRGCNTSCNGSCNGSCNEGCSESCNEGCDLKPACCPADSESMCPTYTGGVLGSYDRHDEEGSSAAVLAIYDGEPEADPGSDAAVLANYEAYTEYTGECPCDGFCDGDEADNMGFCHR